MAASDQLDRLPPACGRHAPDSEIHLRSGETRYRMAPDATPAECHKPGRLDKSININGIC